MTGIGAARVPSIDTEQGPMMKVMAIVKATPQSEAGVMPDAALLEAMTRFNEALAEAGVLLAGEGLKPSSNGVRVRYEGSRRAVSDGPFAEPGTLVAGFWLWQVRSMEEAVEWARRCPSPHPDGGEIELRPLFEAEDFGEALSPDLREREQRLRDATGGA